MRPDIVPGALFPDYELTDHATKRRKLSELQGQHPMVLFLSRGAYLPQRPPAIRTARPIPPRDRSRILPPRHHQHR